MGESAPVSLTSIRDGGSLASRRDDSIGMPARDEPASCLVIQGFLEHSVFDTISVNLGDSQLNVGVGPMGRTFQKALSRELGSSDKTIYDRYKQLHLFVWRKHTSGYGDVQTFQQKGPMGKVMRRLGVSVSHAVIDTQGHLLLLHIFDHNARPRNSHNVGMLVIAYQPQRDGKMRNRRRLQWSDDLRSSTLALIRHYQDARPGVSACATWVPAIGVSLFENFGRAEIMGTGQLGLSISALPHCPSDVAMQFTGSLKESSLPDSSSDTMCINDDKEVPSTCPHDIAPCDATEILNANTIGSHHAADAASEDSKETSTTMGTDASKHRSVTSTAHQCASSSPIAIDLHDTKCLETIPSRINNAPLWCGTHTHTTSTKIL